MTGSYFQTVPEPRVVRASHERAAKGQEDQIHQWAKAHPDSTFTRQDIERLFHLSTQSASRSLANLTDEGKLERTTERALSTFGRTCGTWRAARPKQDGEQGRLFQ